MKSYIQFFVLQGIMMILVGSIFIFANSQTYTTIYPLLLIGGLVFCLGLVIETIADFQLARFKQKSSKEEVLSHGLWAISRHPNYLGEILVWWGLGLIAYQPSTWWVLLSPLLVTLLLRYVSGVPLLEDRYNSNPDYTAYKKSTPSIFPSFK